MKQHNKDWTVIKLANCKKQIARIKRLQQQDFLVFPDHVKIRFKEELAWLQREQAELIELLNKH